MFGWRKRNDGFEWRQYVRTTILVRRERRRQKVEDLREAAVNKVKEAGERGVRAGAVGAEKVGRAAKAGIAEAGRSLQENVWHGWGGWIGARLSRAGAATAAMLGEISHAIKEFARHDSARKGVLAVAGVAVFWAGARYSSHGLDREVTIAAGVALAALAVAALMVVLAAADQSGLGRARDGVRTSLARIPLPDMAGRIGPRGVIAGLAALVVLAAAAMGLRSGMRPELPSLASLPGLGGTAAEAIAGKATAVSGDTLRLSGRSIRLAGIEAPERDQKCGAAGSRPWACGAAAVQALSNRIAGRTVRCEIGGTDASGPRGVCRIVSQVGGPIAGQDAGADLAAELVRGGHVFAETGWFGRYASLEGEARSGKLGLWRSGEAERPSDYRSKRWEEARRTAPDGCPIKGQKSSDRRIYVLPWSPQYDRVKVRAARGERWFCSEAEAQAAGWKPDEKS